MRLCLLFWLLLLSPLSLGAQTYASRQVRFEGAPEYSAAELMKASGLKPSATVSIPDIEAAMQRLADTGLFADTRYAFNPQTLTFTLTPLNPKQMLPVRYGNFVWWAEGDLDPLVRARVPLFHGRLPNNGTLTDAVKAALVALLAEKGVAGATVDAMGSGISMSGMTLTIASPEIKVGEVRLEGSTAGAAAELDKVRVKTSGQDYEEGSTATGLVHAVQQVYGDDGYLDVRVSAPGRGAPRADGPGRYVVDLSAKLEGVDLYTVSAVQVHGAAPVPEGDLKKLVGIKPGDPAGVYDTRVAQKSLAGPYRREGYLDADAKLDVTKDAAAHRVAYTFTLVPGEQYHVAGVQGAGLTPEQQGELAKLRVPPGIVFGTEFAKLMGELNRGRAFAGLRLQMSPEVDKAQHTVVVTLKAVRAPVR